MLWLSAIQRFASAILERQTMAQTWTRGGELAFSMIVTGTSCLVAGYEHIILKAEQERDALSGNRIAYPTLPETVSHLRKLLMRVRFDLATKVSTDASSTSPSTGMESGMRSNGLTK